jgi:hypothetical protein
MPSSEIRQRRWRWPAEPELPPKRGRRAASALDRRSRDRSPAAADSSRAWRCSVEASCKPARAKRAGDLICRPRRDQLCEGPWRAFLCRRHWIVVWTQSAGVREGHKKKRARQSEIEAVPRHTFPCNGATAQGSGSGSSPLASKSNSPSVWRLGAVAAAD